MIVFCFYFLYKQMITKCFSFYVQSQCGNNQVSYSLDQNFPVQDLEYIAL